MLSAKMDLFMDGRAKVSSYRALIETLLETGLPSLTHREAWQRQEAEDKYLCVRHDVDHNLETALFMARIEHELGVRSTYFLLPPGDYDCAENYYGSIIGQCIVQNPHLLDAAQEIYRMGHEIGLHNDFLQLSRKLERNVSDLIAEQLAFFRGAQIEITGSASHGSRFARANKFANYEIFTECFRRNSQKRKVIFDDGGEFEMFSISMKDLGLDYEAYSLKRNIYISDIGSRMIVHGQHFDKISPTMVGDLVGSAKKVVMLTHPEWWKVLDSANPPAFLSAPETTVSVPAASTTSNSVSKPVQPPDSPMFKRPDGKPFRIAVRGDCCSRRAIVMNKQIFPHGVDLIINEKCPNACFVDTLRGIASSRQRGEELSDVGAMPATLKHYYLAQFNRSLLDAENLDLLLIDTYSDMKFELWRHRVEGWPLWIHQKYLHRPEEFKSTFENVGYISLTEAVEAICRVIDHLRLKNPDLPVLILNQPIEYYPKLDKRRDFYQLGELVAKQLPGVYFAATLAKEQLEPVDVGSCGPGLTLHFSGATYMQMIQDAWQRGLGKHLQLPRGENMAAVRIATVMSDPPGTTRVVVTPAAAANKDETTLEQDFSETPRVYLSYRQGSAECAPSCTQVVDAAFKSFAQYFSHPDLDTNATDPRFTPMLIPIDQVLDYEKWEAHIKTFSDGERLRLKRKAISLGYYVKAFAWRMFIPDIHAINHSKSVRSGGAMRGTYLRTIEEMGGAPDKLYDVRMPNCPHHWGMTFGAFLREQGHVQGKLCVDERLLAYISLKRIGDLAIYSQILAHGEHLNKGVLVLLHHEVVRWISKHRNDFTNELRFIMYGGAQNGGEGLFQFKRRSGFIAHRVSAFRAAVSAS